MAFFRNYSGETVSQRVLDERGHGQNVDRGQSTLMNEDAYTTSSEKESEVKMGGSYHSDGDADGARRLQNETGCEDDVGVSSSTFQPSGRRAAMAGKWGSTFWKDCQPMCPQVDDSGQDSKSGSNDKNQDGCDDNSSDGREDRSESGEDDRQKVVDKIQRGHVDVPADEMLSDEYYEQDGEEQSDTLHYKGLNPSSAFNSRPLSKPAFNNAASRRVKTSTDNYYDDNDDASYEDEDEEDDDGDDPDDADFEPDYGATTGQAGNKDKDWGGEDSDEENGGSDDDLDISDEDEAYHTKMTKGRQQGKGGRRVTLTKEHKLLAASGRRRKGRASFEEENSSAKDTDYESDDDFKSVAPRGTSSRKNGTGRSSILMSSGQKSELRSSSRSVRKVSYVESEESEDIDEGKKKKVQKVQSSHHE